MVSPKVGERLKEHRKRKRPKSRSKSSSDRRRDEGRSPLPKRRSEKWKKRHWCRSKKNKKEYHRRHSYLPSSLSSSNDNSDENKYISKDPRFRVVSENDQYKYSLPPDMAQYTNVNFDTYIKEADLLKAVLIKNPVPENINPVKILDERYP